MTLCASRDETIKTDATARETARLILRHDELLRNLIDCIAMNLLFGLRPLTELVATEASGAKADGHDGDAAEPAHEREIPGRDWFFGYGGGFNSLCYWFFLVIEGEQSFVLQLTFDFYV